MSESPRGGANESLSSADVGCSEREILERLANGAPLPELLRAITRLGDHAIEGAACSIWLIENGVLHRGAPSNLPEELLQRMDGLPVGLDVVGSCGRAISRRERCVIADVSVHPSWSRHRDTFLAHGFHASWSTPITSADRVWGTLATYVRQPRSPTTEECSQLDAACHLAAIALERAQTRHEHSALEAHVRETEPLQALGRLASGIVHDFNNVLTAITGHACLALLELEEEQPVHDSLIAIQEASVRAAEVVRKITVHSRPGKGNESRVYLPEATKDAESWPRPAHSEQPKQADPVTPVPVRVMYVDDEEPLVALAVRWLGRLGYKVTGFNDSEAALEAFRAAPRDFDAVISDLSMPTLSGLDLLREVKAIRPDTLVVMSSGYVRPEDNERARELGAVEVVSKPQGMAEFGRILHRILSERRATLVSTSAARGP